ncbi:hypothetical protein JMJ35_003129 [Cladonia borealis]|uniref:Uncharacterized protein n=1 Tax=Cladonia borealis TaxID=184061 RepID=A0AA39V3J2_9LECA|nr:hypothetical protein JMJ35_003129 [Cladonia borealis]
MSDQGFKKQRDLKLHCQKYHPPPKVPELVLDEGLTIEYAHDLENSFTVDLLHQFTSEPACTSVAISGDERYFAVGADRKIYICSLGSGKEVMRFEVNTPGPVHPNDDEYFRDLAFTTNSKFLIGTSKSGRIMTWKIKTKKLKSDRRAHKQDIYAIAISSDGNHLASASGDHDGLLDVEFFLDQQHSILASLDKKLMIVDWRNDSLVETLLGHTSSCCQVCILPISRKIFSASFDKAVKVWSRQKTVEDISPKTNLGYSIERTLTGHEDVALTVNGIPVSVHAVPIEAVFARHT